MLLKRPSWEDLTKFTQHGVVWNESIKKYMMDYQVYVHDWEIRQLGTKTLVIIEGFGRILQQDKIIDIHEDSEKVDELLKIVKIYQESLWINRQYEKNNIIEKIINGEI